VLHAVQHSVAVYKRSLLVSTEKKQVKEQVKEAMNYQELQKKEGDIRTHRSRPSFPPLPLGSPLHRKDRLASAKLHSGMLA